MITREPIFPANRHALYEQHGYSAAIRSGDLLFVSGQVGSRADGTPEPDLLLRLNGHLIIWQPRSLRQGVPLTI